MGISSVVEITAQNILIDYFKIINEKVPLALFKALAGASYFKVNNDMHEITDSLIGNLGYSIYPVESSNNPTVYDFKK